MEKKEISAKTRLLAEKLDHTALAPSLTCPEVIDACRVAREWGAGAMFVQPYWLDVAVATLAGSDVLPATVVGFPHGATLPEAKMMEAELIAARGAKAIDMVINIGALKSGEYKLVEHEIALVVRAAKGIPVKAILETCLLREDEIETACRLACEAGVAYVKTSTGYAGGGATVEVVELMGRSVTGDVKIKASGGIRTLADAEKMLKAGASRIGTSATVAILSELEAQEKN